MELIKKFYINIKFSMNSKNKVNYDQLEPGKKYYIEYNKSFDKYNNLFEDFYRIPYSLEKGKFIKNIKTVAFEENNPEAFNYLNSKPGFVNIKLIKGNQYVLNSISDKDNIYSRDPQWYNFYTYYK
jgi:hypothetical protein